MIARARSMAGLKSMFEDEPFTVAKRASDTVKEFQPVKRQPWTEEWFSEKAEASAWPSVFFARGRLVAGFPDGAPPVPRDAPRPPRG